jgi:hypothetical protein
MPTELIWVADWEMQCCGEPFAVGSRVRWRLSPCGRDMLGAFHDAEEDQPAWYYDHHSDEGTRRPVTREGNVRSIRAVRCAYRQRGQVLTPVSGSAELRPVDRATGWEDDHDEGGTGQSELSFVGYLVELDLLSR